VTESGAGMRLDLWLSKRFSCLSRTAAARHVRQGEIESEWRPLKGSLRMREGEPIRVYVPGLAPDGDPPPLPEVLFEDPRVLVFNKPPGMLAHPAGDRFTWALIGLAKDARPDHHMDLVHRLDRDTSGVLVLTKDGAANALLKATFKNRSVELRKEYLAIVHGEVPWDERETVAPVGDLSTSEVRLRRGVVPDGLPARTTFTVLKRMDGRTLVRCLLHTGRTHQIRVHLEHEGHGIVGDRLYGQPDAVFLDWYENGVTPMVRSTVGFPRQCLHAWRLRLPHPDGGIVELEAPLPDDMRALVDGALPVWPPEDS
jgi:23S rRNA pseudouridine1911/1915/1917 synthase